MVTLSLLTAGVSESAVSAFLADYAGRFEFELSNSSDEVLISVESVDLAREIAASFYDCDVDDDFSDVLFD